jgi:hypothetical protein
MIMTICLILGASETRGDAAVAVVLARMMNTIASTGVLSKSRTRAQYVEAHTKYDFRRTYASQSKLLQEITVSSKLRLIFTLTITYAATAFVYGLVGFLSPQSVELAPSFESLPGMIVDAKSGLHCTVVSDTPKQHTLPTTQERRLSSFPCAEKVTTILN